jgi:hypothetical protein
MRLGEVEPGQGTALHVGWAAEHEYVGQGHPGGLRLTQKQMAGATEAGQPGQVEEVGPERTAVWLGPLDGGLGPAKGGKAAGLKGWLHHLRTDGCVGGGGGSCGPGGGQQQNKTRSGSGGDKVNRCG